MLWNRSEFAFAVITLLVDINPSDYYVFFNPLMLRNILLRIHIKGGKYNIKTPKHEESTPVVQWLSYSSLYPRFAGSIPAGVDEFFQRLKS